MKVQIACLTVLAAMSVTALSAVAADFGNVPPGGVVNGGIKDYGGAGGVPVPAPVPVMESHPAWYFRFDAGVGTINDPSVSESGYQYGGIINGANGTPGATGPIYRDLDPTLFTSDFEHMSTFGGGVGYYLGNGWRMDATIEKRAPGFMKIDGTDDWSSNGYRNSGCGLCYTSDLNSDGASPDRHTTISFKDETKLDGTVWLANAYYDFANYRGFTPYVGAGLGFAWNQIERSHTTKVTSCSVDSTASAPLCGKPGADTTEFNQTTKSQEDNTVTFAAAVMAGLSYDVSEITTIDVGYRYLWIGGTGSTMDIEGHTSKVDFGDQSSHEIRAGLRFNVN